MTTTASTQDDSRQRAIPTQLKPYWPSRIAHDRLWYRRFVESGERFYSPSKGHVFEVSNISAEGDVFDLLPCTVQREGGDISTELSEPAYVDNVCALAGAIEAGDFIHLGDGVIREIGTSTFLTSGPLTVEVPSTSAPEAVLREITTHNGPQTVDIGRLETRTSTGPTATIYLPEELSHQRSTTEHCGPSPMARRQENVETQFFSVSPFSGWTFEDATIREWVESHFGIGDRVLNACAGVTRLTPPSEGEILRNDINDEREAEFHEDVAALAGHPRMKQGMFDVIVFDPPWSLYQSNLRYSGEHVSKEGCPDIDLQSLPFDTPGPDEKTQLGHSRLAKEGFDYLLSSGGIVIELTFHGTSMPSRLGYERVRRAVFDPVGEAKAVIGSVDRKTRRQLSDFF